MATKLARTWSLLRFGLDPSYTTESIIAMGIPSQGIQCLRLEKSSLFWYLLSLTHSLHPDRQRQASAASLPQAPRRKARKHLPNNLLRRFRTVEDRACRKHDLVDGLL